MALSRPEAVAEELVAAIAAQDWGRLEACFAPDVRLFAALPSTDPLRERAGPHERPELLQA